MAALGEHSNVYGTALKILEQKGFNVWYDRASDHFYAEKDGWDLCSDSPCGLLGLAAIYDFVAPKEYSEYWWRLPGSVDYTKLSTTAPVYTSVMSRDSEPGNGPVVDG